MQILNHYFLKLLQKSHIGIHEISEIWYPILDHHEAIESKSKGETSINLWIETALTYHIWMDESSTHEFDPARSFTDLAPLSIAEWAREVDFDSWLDKREVSRSHTDRDLFSEDI